MKTTFRNGFTLIELMIVVAIIAIIAAIAIPNMLRSRLTAQETSAIATLRTISSAQAAAQAQTAFPDPTTGIGLYGSFVEFAGMEHPALDIIITTPPHIKSGYTFSLEFAGQTDSLPAYQAYAQAQNTGRVSRNFFVDGSGVIRYTNDGSKPTSVSPAI